MTPVCSCSRPQPNDLGACNQCGGPLRPASPPSAPKGETGSTDAAAADFADSIDVIIAAAQVVIHTNGGAKQKARLARLRAEHIDELQQLTAENERLRLALNIPFQNLVLSDALADLTALRALLRRWLTVQPKLWSALVADTRAAIGEKP